VTFIDLNDPKSAQVDPPNGLSQTFGNGVQLRNVTIEIVSAGIWPLTLLGLTGEPVTWGIEKKITGLKNPNTWNEQLRGEAYRRGALQVGAGNFIRGG
jgi:hypothetical protein